MFMYFEAYMRNLLIHTHFTKMSEKKFNTLNEFQEQGLHLNEQVLENLFWDIHLIQEYSLFKSHKIAVCIAYISFTLCLYYIYNFWLCVFHVYSAISESAWDWENMSRQQNGQAQMGATLLHMIQHDDDDNEQ